MSENQFFERKGPFPLSEIIKTIGCGGDFSQKNNFEIRSVESLDNATETAEEARDRMQRECVSFYSSIPDTQAVGGFLR